MSYLGRSAKLSLKAQEKVSFLATAGQTVKTGLSYTPSFIEVYVNGVLLTDTTDFTATNGNSVTFTVALLLNDEVTVISLKTFTVADHYNKTEADTLLAAKATNTALALKAPIASPSFTGNVGVGTSSSEATLHVSKQVAAGSDNLALKLHNPTNAIDARVGIGFHVNANTGSNWDGAYIQSGNSGANSGDLRFGRVTDNTLTEAMRIDAAGIVTKPSQPAFRVCKDTGDTTSTGYIVWNASKINVGGHYSTSTGKFTAPVAGNYYFAVRALTASATQNNIWIGINHNGNSVLQTYHSHINHSNISGEAVITMAANDYVQTYWGGTGSIHTGGTNHHIYSFFQGHLIG